MCISTEQFLASQKESIDNLVAAQNRLFSGFEQLVNLNMKVFKTSLDEVAEKTQKAAGLKDVQDATGFAADLSQPSVERAVDYGKNVFERSEERRVGKECRSRWSPYKRKREDKRIVDEE